MSTWMESNRSITIPKFDINGMFQSEWFNVSDLYIHDPRQQEYCVTARVPLECFLKLRVLICQKESRT
jgi:hypothetical protein